MYIHICIYVSIFIYKHRVYLKFLQGSLSSSLELVGCLGDACRNFPCHHEGGCSTFLGSFLGEEKLPSEAERIRQLCRASAADASLELAGLKSRMLELLSDFE